MSLILTALTGGGRAGRGKAANVIDFKTGFDNADGSSYSPSVTISTLTGSNKGIVAVCFTHDGSGGAESFNNAQFNGNTGVAVGSTSFSQETSTAAGMSVFYWLNADVPTGGTYTLNFTSTGPVDSGGYALFTIDNLDQTSPVVQLSTAPEPGDRSGASFLFLSCDADDGAAAGITSNHDAGINIDHSYVVAESGNTAAFSTEMTLAGITSANYDATGNGGASGTSWYLHRINAL